VGRLTRIVLLEGPRSALLAPPDSNNQRPKARGGGHLPPPVAKVGKPIPHTIYTAKNFDTARTASSSLLIRREEDGATYPEETCGSSCRAKLDEQLEEDDDEEHLPAGQHLLVDMNGIDSAFLNSEERLGHAMVEVVNQASLTLLSYHCHTLVPSGVSCVGVLLESHVSFHTWPSAGVITLDLFTCGSNPLLPVVPMIERLFGVPASLKVKPKVVWAHKLRGFRNESGPLQTWDMGANLLSIMDMEYKKEIHSVQTDFQRIDVYDTISKRFNTLDNYEKSLSADGSYYSENPDLFSPDRIVYLDGIMQSTRKGENAYHESLVHPALFAHPKPERVAIIGGGEGATLREVLKHNTVKDAIMIEIDEIMVSVSRQYLPAWSDCSDLVGSASWCGDDDRSQVYYEDALQWFIDRYYDEKNITDELLDVIIMDALDPHIECEFSDALYNNQKYLTSLYNALSEDGILVVQVGESPDLDDPAEMLTHHKNRAVMTDHLAEIGFKSIHMYGNAHGGYTNTWNNMLAAKSDKVRSNWYRNEAQINLAMQQRSVESKSGAPVFKYFDGATMQFFQMPSKRFETVFCRKEPTPPECLEWRGFDPEIENAGISSFEVKVSGAGDNSGRGLYAKKDIPKGTYLTIDTSSFNVFFPPNTFSIIIEMEHQFDELVPVEVYMHGYGYQSHYHGEKEVTVDSTITTFTNHGCNGSYNSGEFTDLNEFTADLTAMPAALDPDQGKSVYNPVEDRHFRLMLSGNDKSLRDIAAGEELLDNYLGFIGHSSDWQHDILALRAQCSGHAGEITEYEKESR